MTSEPTNKELELAARANELADAAALPTGASGGILGQAVNFLMGHVTRGILTAGLAVFIAYHAWAAFNDSQQMVADLQTKRAEVGQAQAEAAALNKKVADTTTAQKTLEAELKKTQADADAAQADAAAATHSVDGMSARVRQLRAELEQKQADAKSAKADAAAALQLFNGVEVAIAQKQAEVASAEATARMKVAGIKQQFGWLLKVRDPNYADKARQQFDKQIWGNGN